jgi:hypothetical protein
MGRPCFETNPCEHAFRPSQRKLLRRALLVAAVAMGLASVSACSKDDGRVKVYPVNGKVLVGGQPAARARVVFYPVAEELKKPGMPIPDGTTDNEGNFKLRSYDPGDGAPEGDYKVSVIWLDVPEGAEENPLSAKDRLGGRYANPQKSNLTATVPKGGGEIPPFELQ